MSLIVALLVSFLPSTVSAQACPAGQTCFYVPPAMIHPGGPDTVESEIWLSIPSGMATGSYRVDGGAEVTFTVMDTAALRVPLMLTAMSSGVNIPEVRGVFVISSREDLLVEHKQSLFVSGTYTEGYSETVPRHTVALGTRFRLGGYRMTQASPIGHAATSQYAVITAPAGAMVTLTAPPGAALPYWTGSATETHTLDLGPGESASVAANALLDGALLVATAPVSVAAGGRGWLSPCGDNGSDLLVPTSQWGTQFAVRLPTGTVIPGSAVSVIADLAGTEVRVDGALVATLGPGETHSFVPTTPAYIETSLPALVWKNGSLRSCELDTALIPPLELVALPLAITFNASFTGEAAVVIATAEVASVTLDGGALTPTSSTALTGRADITVVVFDVTPWLHTVRADHGFQLLAASAGAGAGILAYFGPFVSCMTAADCEDLGPCTVAACETNACVATPVAAGMSGECSDGLVCSGDTGPLVNTCVGCASAADCSEPTPLCDAATGTCVAGPDAGMAMVDAGPGDPDSGPGDPDSGPGDPDSGPGTPDSGPIESDGGGTGGDAGRVGGGDEGGCGCSVPGRRDREGAFLALAILGGLVFARRRRR